MPTSRRRTVPRRRCPRGRADILRYGTCGSLQDSAGQSEEIATTFCACFILTFVSTPPSGTGGRRTAPEIGPGVMLFCNQVHDIRVRTSTAFISRMSKIGSYLIDNTGLDTQVSSMIDRCKLHGKPCRFLHRNRVRWTSSRHLGRSRCCCRTLRRASLDLVHPWALSHPARNKMLERRRRRRSLAKKRRGTTNDLKCFGSS